MATGVRIQTLNVTQSASERFIDLHPGHKDVAYAYYLMGMCYYEQISDVGRDQEMTQRSQEAFDELIRRFPDSDYSKDAELKVLACDTCSGDVSTTDVRADRIRRHHLEVCPRCVKAEP